ncbi:MAG: hypothetical protein ACJAQT_004358 [Akkermansiaceae bacterium]|jgi:hypothetical protein
MKNTIIIPAFAVTAAAAFGLGWVVRPDSNETEKAGLSERGKVSSAGSSRSAGGGSRGDAAANGPQGEFLTRYLVDGKISSEDMKEAIKEMSQTNDPLLRQKMFALLLENLTADNAKDAFLALKENRRGGPFGRGNEDELRLMANAWGRLDGAGAVAALKEISEASGEEEERGRGRGGRGGGEMSSVLAGWATVDGAGATSYLNGLEDEREQRTAAFGIVQGMLVNGVGEAMSFIQGMPESEGGDRTKGMFVAMVAGEILEQGLDEAKSWVDTVKDPELRKGALARVTMEIMNDDRQAAADWIAQFGDEESAVPAVSRLADSWSREDPQAVLKWADQLSGQSKAEAYQEAVGSWAREDPAAAGEFLETLQASPERDAAVEGYATRVSRDDPSAAMDWANTIANEELRQETQVDVARDWYRKDQAAATEWVQTSGLSEEAVNSISEGGGGRDFGRRGPGGR